MPRQITIDMNQVPIEIEGAIEPMEMKLKPKLKTQTDNQMEIEWEIKTKINTPQKVGGITK